MERLATRQELIEDLISWKEGNPSRVRVWINNKEVVTKKELGMRLNPEAYNLPRVF